MSAESRTLGERCITWGADGPPMLGSTYNANFQILQNGSSVVILTEMIHSARIIFMDGRPHIAANIHQLAGDSRGHWEGDTLVVDSTNFSTRPTSADRAANARQDIFSSPELHVIERFTRVDDNTIVYRFTVDDPATWTKPWSGETLIRKTRVRFSSMLATRETMDSWTSSPALAPLRKNDRTNLDLCGRRSFLLSALGGVALAKAAAQQQGSSVPAPRSWTGDQLVRYPDPDVVALDNRFRRYIVGNTVIQRLFTGTLWAEGVAWNGVGRYLVWSDIPNNRQMRWMEEDGHVTVFRSPSGFSNGNTFDYEGRELSCEHGNRRVVAL